eukprot:jgi/Galph1/2629/GphlegSOOS_G1305.1
MTGDAKKEKSRDDKFQGAETAIFVWFLIDAATHIFCELPFVIHSLTTTVNQASHWSAILWKEYAKADPRWGRFHDCTVALEVPTSILWGPLSLACAYGLYYRRPWRFYWQTILSLGELYGNWMTFGPEWLNQLITGKTELDPHNNWVHKWIYLFFANIVWVIIPLLLMIESTRTITAACAKAKAQEMRQYQLNVTGSYIIWIVLFGFFIVFVTYAILLPLGMVPCVLNLKTEQLSHLRSSKTLGRGQKRRYESRGLKRTKRNNDELWDSVPEEIERTGEPKEDTVCEPLIDEMQKNREESTSGKTQDSIIQIDWNNLLWSSRKRKRTDENVATETHVENSASLELQDHCSEGTSGPLQTTDCGEVTSDVNCLVVNERNSIHVRSLMETKKVQKENSKLGASILSMGRFLAEDSHSIPMERKNQQKKVFVCLNRTKDELKNRMQLPIYEKEQEIVEAVHERDILFITGETGSGKTTQMPQFLYETGYCSPTVDGYVGKIVVTQPRRVGAFACSSRVAKELHFNLGKEVGYHVRHQRMCSAETLIEFVTDGILLRHLEKDILLRQYSVVILDEVHERSINTDILLGLLTRSVQLRREIFENGEKIAIRRDLEAICLPPLKLVIMSATFDIDVLITNERLFAPNIPKPVVIGVESRQFPVHIHFARRTVNNYLQSAFKTVCKIHRKLPLGDILVFLTGRREILYLCRQLSMELQGSSIINKKGSFFREIGYPRKGVRILPLYSMLSWKRQQMVFSKSLKGVRTIVVATNVAETSITIPNIVYVVDSGKVKEREYTKLEGHEAFSMTQYRVRWISQSSAEQRAGRAGRTCEGHCYRLYSAAVFLHEFEDQRAPEVQRTSPESLVLRVKSFHLHSVYSFPFPSPPSQHAIENAERTLCLLGALETSADDIKQTRLTNLGRRIAKLPLSPRLAKLVLESCQSLIVCYAIRIAALLTINDLFVSPEEEDNNSKEVLVADMDNMSEVLSTLYSFCAWEYGIATKNVQVSSESFGLREKAAKEVSLIINQLVKHLKKHHFLSEKEARSCWFPVALQPASSVEREHLMLGILRCFPEQVCRHLSSAEAMQVGIKGRRKREAFETFTGRIVFLPKHRKFTCNISEIEYMCYLQLTEKSSTGIEEKEAASSVSNSKVIMQYCTVVSSKSLIASCSSFCVSSTPLLSPPPRYDPVKGSVVCSVYMSYSPRKWSLGIIEVPFDDDKYSEVVKSNKQEWISLDRYRVFGRYLLEGKVFEMLTQWKSYLKESPMSMIESPTKDCVMKMYEKLHHYRVYRKRTLITIWKVNPFFLLQEYLNFCMDLNNSYQLISESWPLLQREEIELEKGRSQETQ